MNFKPKTRIPEKVLFNNALEKSKKLKETNDFMSSPIFKTILDRNLNDHMKLKKKVPVVPVIQSISKPSDYFRKEIMDKSLTSMKKNKKNKISKSLDNIDENMLFNDKKNQKNKIINPVFRNSNLAQSTKVVRRNPALNNNFFDETAKSMIMTENFSSKRNSKTNNIGPNSNDLRCFPYSELRQNNNKFRVKDIKKNNDRDSSKDSITSHQSFKTFFMDKNEESNKKNYSNNSNILKKLLVSTENGEKIERNMKKYQNNVINVLDTSENINININNEQNESKSLAMENRKEITKFLFNVIKDFEKIINEGPNSIDTDNESINKFCVEKSIENYKKIHRFFNETQLSLLKFNKELDSGNKNIIFTILTFFSTFNSTRLKNLENFQTYYEKKNSENMENYEEKLKEIENLTKQIDSIKNDNSKLKKDNERIVKENKELVENNNNYREKIEYELLQYEENNKQLVLENTELNNEKLALQEKIDKQKKEITRLTTENNSENNYVDKIRNEHFSKKLAESLEENNKLYAENDSLKAIIKTQSEKNEKVMKLLYAVKKTGIDIEKLYIDEVMNTQPCINAIESKYCVEKVDEMPEEEEASDCNSKRKENNNKIDNLKIFSTKEIPKNDGFLIKIEDSNNNEFTEKFEKKEINKISNEIKQKLKLNLEFLKGSNNNGKSSV